MIKKSYQSFFYSFISTIFILTFCIVATEVFFIYNERYNFLEKKDSRQFKQLTLPKTLIKKYNDNWKNNLNLPKPSVGDSVNYSLKYESNKIIRYSNSILNHYQPDITAHSKVSFYPSNKTLYKVSYQIDNVGRRKVINRKRAADKALIMLGGSNTWGDGVEDEFIFPNLIQNKLNNYEVYIAAKPGFGAGEILYSLKNNSFLFKDIKQKNGTALYFFIDDHPNRSLPSLQSLRNNYLLSKPIYKEKNNKLIFSGFYKNSFIFNLYSRLAQSKTLQFINFNLPINHKEKATQLFVQTLLEIETQLKINHNINNLLLISVQTGHNEGFGDLVRKKWEGLGRTFYDIGSYDFKTITNNQHKFPLDRHKTPPVHWLRSELLNPILLKNNIN